MNNVLVSIIVPVYNGQQYIKKCIDSIMNQSYNNIELLIINDGSTDHTKQILDYYSNNEKIRVFNNKNHGVSYSRNYGMSKAKGDYILFVDSDDLLLKDAVSVLVSKALQYDVDIIRFNGLIQEKNGKFKTINMPVRNDKIIDTTIDKDSLIRLIHYPQNSLRCYCPLLFIRNNNIIDFDISLKYLEDKVFYLKNLLCNKKVLFIKDELYVYNYNCSSRTKNIDLFKDNILEIIKSGKVIKSVINNYSHNIHYSDSSILVLIMYRMKYLAISTSYKVFKGILKDVYKDSIFNSLMYQKLNSVDLKNKILIFFLKKKMWFLFYHLCILKM